MKEMTSKMRILILQNVSNDGHVYPHNSLVFGVKQILLHSFFPFGKRTGHASVAIACRLWKVDPIRSHSLVPILGAFAERGRCNISPPLLFTMKRCRKPIVLPNAGFGSFVRKRRMRLNETGMGNEVVQSGRMWKLGNLIYLQ